MTFGDPVTNVCAGEQNPLRHAYFVRRKGQYIELTDRKGKFWDMDPEVIFPGHLDSDECARRWAPIWEKRFGKVNP